MLAKARHEAIMNILLARKVIKMSEIAEEFGVSMETARRDLIDLEDQDLVTRISGGAMLKPHPMELPAFPRTAVSYSEKIAIARKAASLIEEYDSIFLDVGSTIYELANCLKDFHHLTIYTSSLMVINALMFSDNRIIVLGGELHAQEQHMLGLDTSRCMERYFVDKAFSSCMGITLEFGATDLTQRTGFERTVVARHSKELFLLADSSKWGHNSTAISYTMDQLQSFVVDSNLPEDTIAALRARGKTVYVAPMVLPDEEES